MIRKLNVEVLGVVENYVGEVFGSGAGRELASDLSLPFLGEVALRADYRDDSQPTVLASAEVRAEYDSIWAALEDRLIELEAMPGQQAVAEGAGDEPR